jgi:hypothetical protein
MTAIPFTQYLMPDGRAKQVSIDRPDEIAAKAQQIIAKGYRFECEMLSDWQTISLTITDPDEGDVEIEVVENGPDVPLAVDRMIERFQAA